MDIFVKFRLILRFPLTKYGHVTWEKMQISIFFLFPISKFNISTGHKISSRKDLYFRSYQHKTSRWGGGGGGGCKTPPVPLGEIFCNVSPKWAIYF